MLLFSATFAVGVVLAVGGAAYVITYMRAAVAGIWVVPRRRWEWEYSWRRSCDAYWVCANQCTFAIAVIVARGAAAGVAFVLAFGVSTDVTVRGALFFAWAMDFALAAGVAFAAAVVGFAGFTAGYVLAVAAVGAVGAVAFAINFYFYGQIKILSIVIPNRRTIVQLIATTAKTNGL